MNDSHKNPPLLVILGQTAVGKTDLSIELAAKRDGEVVSADSRQVYRHMDIGTAKITAEEMRGIPHHMIDICEPSDVYTVAQFQRDARAAIDDIHSRGKLPILVGGSSMYVSSIIDNPVFVPTAINHQLRLQLDGHSTPALFQQLREADPEHARAIDQQNRRRLIRALEIISEHGKVSPLKHEPSPYDMEIIGLRRPTEELRERIALRNRERLENDALVAEVQRLHDEHGVSWQRLHDLGLEYRYVSQYIQDEITRDELLYLLDTKIWQFAKRQATWWRRDERIQWRDAS